LKIRFPAGDDLGAVASVRKVIGDSELAIAMPRKAWHERQPFLLKVNPQPTHVAPDVELNLPLVSTRRIQTCFVRNRGSLILCHRGKFTVFKSSLGPTIGRRKFRARLVVAQERNEEVQLIKVAVIPSPSFPAALLDFARKVNELKARFRSHPTGVPGRSRLRPREDAADPSPGLFSKLGNLNKLALKRLLNALKASLRDLKQGETKGTTRSARRAQSKFANAVLAESYSHRGKDAAICPGCKHKRCKSNGDPILQAHHLVGFKSTKSMDPRWGAPLCPNCHVAIERASDPVRKSIGKAILRRLPYVKRNLGQLWVENAMRPAWIGHLRSLGLTIPEKGI
jgi:hypothetical protein